MPVASGRERNDGLYRVITYLCAKMLDELIVAVLVSFVLSCVLFYGAAFPGSLVLFWLVYLTTLSIGIGAPQAPPHRPLLPVILQDANYHHHAVLACVITPAAQVGWRIVLFEPCTWQASKDVNADVCV